MEKIRSVRETERNTEKQRDEDVPNKSKKITTPLKGFIFFKLAASKEYK